MGFPLPDPIEEAKRIVNRARERGILLRVMGSCIVRLHCPKYSYLHIELGRTLFDIDLMSYGIFESKMEKLFKDLGYAPRERIFKYWERATSSGRHIYDDDRNNRSVDVFFDKFEMCHTINFKNRLELDFPTIALADILLQKMQIIELTEKDVIDTILVLKEHKIGETDKEMINSDYMAELLSKDWGFYYTVTKNFNKVEMFLKQNKIFAERSFDDITTKINELVRIIDQKPKSLRWKLRAKIGTRKRWYNEVEEVMLPGTCKRAKD